MIEGHGDDLFRYGYSVKHNFSSNILQDVDHSGLYEYMRHNMPDLTSYPDPHPGVLEAKIALCCGVDSCEVMVTNGATEAIYMIAAAYGGAKSYVVGPTFSEYADACRLYGHEVTYVGTIGDIVDDVDCVWLCNPNNPTGRVVDEDVLLAAIDSHPSTLFVIDHAYCDYTMKKILSFEEGVARDNVIMLYSMTKRYSVPGLRLGYMVGNRRIMSDIKQRRMPWMINKISEQAAGYLIEHSDEYHIDAASLNSEAMRISGAFVQMGIVVEPTDSNFILCKLPRRTAAELKQWLMSEFSILIRDASNFVGLSDAHFRVAAQTQEQNDILIKALKQWTY